MAFSNTYDTTNPGSGVSNREDLTDIYEVLAPEETPVLTMAPKRKAEAINHEWTVDTLAAPSTTAVAEGVDVTAFVDKFAGMARLGNRCTERRRAFMVSKKAAAVRSVAPVSIAKAESKAIRELKRDIEMTLIGTQDKATEDGAGTADQARGLGDWLDSSGPSDVPAAFRTPSGSIHASGTLTETVLNNLITSIYRVNGKANDLTYVVDTAARAIVTGFTGSTGSTNTTVRTINQNADGNLKFTVSTYQADNGFIDIVNMNPDCAPDTTNKDYGYLINFDYLGVADLLPIGSQQLPNLGGGERGYVDWIGTLEVLHPGAHGVNTVIA